MTDSHRRAAILSPRRRAPYHTSFGQTCIPVCLLTREQRHLAGEFYGQASLALRQAAPKIEPTQIRIKTEQNEEFWPLPCCSTTGCVSIGSVCPRRLTPRANSLNDRCITLLLPGLLGEGNGNVFQKGLRAIIPAMLPLLVYLLVAFDSCPFSHLLLSTTIDLDATKYSPIPLRSWADVPAGELVSSITPRRDCRGSLRHLRGGDDRHHLPAY